ncbi:hypothetical protein FANTH_9397 [Fusarium anthophilum]|uniref:Uncharacterized protein n=1 Tax=Fusarium anthophilum TaxID=48485 RepID=A0A8H5DZC3_9HYPO|nr:hypothetical protein FANTH_9397 [Fusarium anthophilum]
MISEETNRQASVLRACSLPHYPAESFAPRRDTNAPFSSDWSECAYLLLDNQEANEQTDLYELPPADRTSLLASYRDFILYGEQNCFNDLESPFFEQAYVMPQAQDENGSINDDDGQCYCGYCMPLLLQDGAEQEEDLWVGDSEVASAA